MISRCWLEALPVLTPHPLFVAARLELTCGNVTSMILEFGSYNPFIIVY